MTLVPECQLAKELGMCYCSLATITDYDMWKDEHVDAHMVKKVMAENSENLIQLLEKGLLGIVTGRSDCASDAKTAGTIDHLKI